MALLLLAGCSLSFGDKKEKDANGSVDFQNGEFTDEDIIEHFGIGTENFDALTHGDIDLTKDEGEGVLEYTISYDELDLNVEGSDFEFGQGLYFVLSQDLELLTHMGLEDIGIRNDEHNGIDGTGESSDIIDEEQQDEEQDEQQENQEEITEGYENLYTGLIYDIKDIGVIEMDIGTMVHLVYEMNGTIEFSWFEDFIEWDSDKIEQKYKEFKERHSQNE